MLVFSSIGEGKGSNPQTPKAHDLRANRCCNFQLGLFRLDSIVTLPCHYHDLYIMRSISIIPAFVFHSFRIQWSKHKATPPHVQHYCTLSVTSRQILTQNNGSINCYSEMSSQYKYKKAFPTQAV